MSVVTAAADRFHEPPSSDAWWSETAWFSFWIPERRLSGTIYLLFRRNLGICSSAVYVWDDGGEAPWEVLYGKTWSHLPWPSGDLAQLSLASGLAHECLEPLQRYRLRYAEANAVELDLTFAAALPPHGLANAPERGHFDQPGRVTGTLRLGGESFRVDCLAMRDRSWSVRADSGALRGGYAYATTAPGSGFHVISFFTGEDDQVVAGYLVRDGMLADITSGRRRVIERERGRPLRVLIDAADTLGRRLSAEGRCVNRLAFQASPGIFAWMSLTEWQFDDHNAWGEHQDIWSPEMLRAFIRQSSNRQIRSR